MALSDMTSVTPAWLALTTDWWESPMFDEISKDDRLAARGLWACILARAMSHGKGSYHRQVRMRTGWLASIGATRTLFDEFIESAVRDGAIERDGESIVICNWGFYQMDDVERKKSLIKKSSLADAWKPPSPYTGTPTCGIVVDPSVASLVWREDKLRASVTAQWTEAYPDVDVAREIASCIQYFLAKPRRPQANWRRRVNNWLRKSQNWAENRSARPGPDRKRDARAVIDEAIRKSGDA